MTAWDDIQHGVEGAWESLADGWQRLRRCAASALTRFTPGKSALSVPERDEDRDLAAPGWAMLAGDVYEDEHKLLIRLEVPGMEKHDFDIEVRGDTLIVKGEKHFERESSQGRYRILQCAYGNFQRVIPLPTGIRSDRVEASYRNGVLKIELPKAEPSQSSAVEIEVR